MTKLLEQLKPGEQRQERVKLAVTEALGRTSRSPMSCRHRPAARFRPGQALEIERSIEKGEHPVSVRLHYRHVNQAERYRIGEMQAEGGRYRASIAADYTASPYPIEYFFTADESQGAAWPYPGFEANLANQPYFVVRQG